MAYDFIEPEEDGAGDPDAGSVDSCDYRRD
jgi:hypothetical protein